ncbi:MAG: hypothetical protein HY665_05710 [Chloroflexi bacterium]|nr:hypothetical protein [Chloroflexota bacterium]
MLQVKATSIAKVPLYFPAYLVLEINGGYKLKDPTIYFGSFEQRVEATCPFAGGCADMSAQSKTSGYVRVKANLRVEKTRLTVRVDNAHGGRFHLDVERDNNKIELSQPVELNPERPPLLSAFELAKNELLKRGLKLLPTFGSAERPTLNMLQRLWEAKFSVNDIEISMLLPPYPGYKLTRRFYTPSDAPFRIEPTGLDLKVEPFDWEKHM